MATPERVSWRIAMLGALALITAACTAVPGASPAESGATTQSAASAAPPTEQDCYQITAEASGPPETIEDIRRDATSVIVGIFSGYGQARWNTPDGHRPPAAEVQDTSARLVRPVIIELKGQIRGARVAAEHAIARGGTLGCDTVTYSDEEKLADGQRYVYFLMPVTNSDGQPSEDLLLVGAWPVDPQDVVRTPGNGDISLAELTGSIEKGPKPTAAPSPGEPSGQPEGTAP